MISSWSNSPRRKASSTRCGWYSMSLRSAVGHLLISRPSQQPLLSHLVHQPQQVPMASGQHCPRALVAAVLGGPLAHLSALFFRDRIEPILARFTAGQDIAGVESAGGTA